MNRKDARTQGEELEEPDPQLNRLASVTIDAAIEVHRRLGPGFLESVYEKSLCVELALRGISYRRQVPVAIQYKGTAVGEGRLDLLVDERLVVELKAVAALEPIYLMQIRSHLKATTLRLGILINFNELVLLRGVRRVVLTPDLASLRPCG